jgi:GTP cyclohydrolase I
MFINRKSSQDIIESYLIMAINELNTVYPELDVLSDHLKDTPHRISKMWIESFKGLGDRDWEFTTFPYKSEIGNEFSNWIVIKNIEFSSWCAHHFLPFSGTIDIGYVPNALMAGASKLPRAVEYLSARPQVQETLGEDIVEFLYSHLRTSKICVRITSKHSCIQCRGVKSRNSEMVTLHSFTKKDLHEFLEMLK